MLIYASHDEILRQLEEIYDQQLYNIYDRDGLDIVNEYRQRLDLGEGHLDNTSQDVIEIFDGNRCD